MVKQDYTTAGERGGVLRVHEHRGGARGLGPARLALDVKVILTHPVYFLSDSL